MRFSSCCAGETAGIESLAAAATSLGVITAALIRELLQARPFRPFRLTLSDGSHHDILHHDMAWVTRHTVEVGINLASDGLVLELAWCSILHITKLEHLPVAPTPSRGREEPAS